MRFDSNIISERLLERGRQLEVLTFPETTSTNDLARFLAASDDRLRFLAADAQTRGKGSHGRSFYSPDSTGFYVTLAVPGTDPGFQATLAAGVAAAAAVRAVYGSEVRLKWVNDLRYSGRKVGGILCERLSSGTVLVGLGINLCSPEGGFPAELRETAGSLEADPGRKNDLAADFVHRFLSLAETPETVLPRYRVLCETLGRRVRFMENGTEREGLAADIGADGSLIIEEDGVRKTYASGEISVRTAD